MSPSKLTSGNLNDVVQRYKSLLEISRAIASNHNQADLFSELAHHLRQAVRFDYLNVVLHEPVHDVMRLYLLESARFKNIEPGAEFPIDDSFAGWVWKHQKPYCIPNLDQETRFVQSLEVLRQHMIKSYYILPVSTAQRRLGALGIGNVTESAYSQADIEFLQQAANQVAVSLDNALNFRAAAAHQQQLARERDRLGLLLDVTNALVTSLDFQALFANTTHCLRRVIPHEYTSVALHNGEALRVEAVDYPGTSEFFRAHVQSGASSGPAEVSFQSRKAIIFDEAELRRFPSGFTQLFINAGMRTLCCLPLVRTHSVLGVLMLGSSRTEAFRPDDTDLLCQVANQIAIAIDNALAYQQIAELKDRLNKEKLYLEDEIRSEHDFGEIVGVSDSLKGILQLVETVAPTDSTVLIRGETGTGKELIARAIHNFSGRRARTFVKLNCAAIPTGLLESELFGHERGAFTGAIAQRIGRFELAHQGTLFLDEVGDIPLELQPKLLRVLQEMEFERLGSTRTLKVNVRLVAATNRDLLAMVSEGRFRSDLYYRLNIFPVHMPPLRERADDIPKLVQFFAQKYAIRLKKKITTIAASDLEALRDYSWPGNIRELENFVERAVILSRGVELALPMGELRGSKEGASAKGLLVERRRSDRKVFTDHDVSSLTLRDAERQHILTALRVAQWKIGGPTGAAARLGMKRTTLNSRMKRLGISRTRSDEAANN